MAPEMADIPTAVTYLTCGQALQHCCQTTDVTGLVIGHPHADASPGAWHNWLLQQAPEPHATSLHLLRLTSDVNMLQDLAQQLVRQAKQLHGETGARCSNASAISLATQRQHRKGGQMLYHSVTADLSALQT